jgi:hypothetical protein
MNRVVFWIIVWIGVLGLIGIGAAVFFSATSGDAQFPIR